MSGTRESVIRMANQIARNFAVHGEEKAVAETAEHISLFWDPRMKEMAAALVAEPDCGLSPLALQSLQQVAKRA